MAKKSQAPQPTMDDFMGDDNTQVQDQTTAPEQNDEENEEDQTEEETKKMTKKERLNIDNYDQPMARLHREDGKLKRLVPVQLQGLSSEMLPPITRKKTAIYMDINHGKIDPLTNEPVDIQPLIVPGVIVVYDPFEPDVLKRHKTIKNVVRFENVIINGQNVPKEVVEDIVFENGLKQVNQEKDYLIYAILELHQLNDSYKFRQKSGQAAAFRRVDVYRREWAETTNMDLALEAENSVVKLRTPSEIIALATAAGIPTAGRIMDGREGSIKYDLRKFARKNPRDFFKLSKGTEGAVRLDVLDAIELGLVEYSADKKKWFFTTSGHDIGRHLPDVDPTEGLIRLFLNPEYVEHYKTLQKQLHYFD